MKKKRYVYVVLCNEDPIVYGVCSSYKKAQDYADRLIADRKTQEGFYHTLYGLASNAPGKQLRFSICIKGGRYEGCFIKVIQYPLI